MTSATHRFDGTAAANQEQPVFVLTTPTCEKVTSVLADSSRYGPAVRCFLSPFDALLDMLFLQRRNPDVVDAVLRSSRLPSAIFYSSCLRQRPLTLQVAWLAHENRLVAYHDGRLVRAAREQAGQWRRRRRAPAMTVIEPATLAVLERLHERAGLFAWRDTLQIVDRWVASPAQEASALRRAVAALDAVEPIIVPVDAAEQLALYDPEGAHWHFVSRDLIL
ncbi:hypothetical protein [Burkholderia ubonensis]|uniref:hypothetical protein n=1 Tax=Burkholderia ubonensis TaxID=101571 RepID=UPI000A978424|nr:hypothetical protein [Burkholderia ubonensis]